MIVIIFIVDITTDMTKSRDSSSRCISTHSTYCVHNAILVCRRLFLNSIIYHIVRKQLRACSTFGTNLIMAILIFKFIIFKAMTCCRKRHCFRFFTDAALIGRITSLRTGASCFYKLPFMRLKVKFYRALRMNIAYLPMVLIIALISLLVGNRL